MAFANVTSFRVVPNHLPGSTGGYSLYWRVSTGGFTPLFMPQVSIDGAGDWTDLLEDPTDDLSAVNIGPKFLSFTHPVAFRLLILDENEEVFATSSEISPEHVMNRHDWLMYREMLRREEKGLNKYNGIPGFLLRRRQSGTKCPDCMDETLDTPSSTECETCLGTGWTGGYYAPLPMMADWVEGAAPSFTTVQDQAGPNQVEKIAIYIMPFPDVKFKDVWIDKATDHRFEVTSTPVKSDLFRSLPTNQIVTLSRIPLSDPVYSIPQP